jgi:hypothetical protein
MQEPFVHLVYSRNVIEFVTVAREVCQFLESVEKYPKQQFVDVSLKVLPLLYLKAVSLPHSELELEDATDRFVSEMDYTQVKMGIEDKMGAHNDYLEVFTPDFDRSEAALTATIAEDLADIYQDLKDFLGNYRTGATEIMNDALVELVNHFEMFWGQKAVNCLRALHNVKYSADGVDDDETSVVNSEQAPRKSENFFDRRQREWRSDEDELLL